MLRIDTINAIGQPISLYFSGTAIHRPLDYLDYISEDQNPKFFTVRLCIYRISNLQSIFRGNLHQPQ